MTDTLQRYKMVLAYRGTHYHGWQKQPVLPNYKGIKPRPGEGIPTIQAILSKAVVSVVRHPITLHASSRTDAGVHAKGQLIHFDSNQTQIPPEGMRRAINAELPDDILVRSIEEVPSSFDAIRSTTRKRYQYLIWNGYDRDPFLCDLAWHRWQTLDIPAMVQAATYLVGKHDFASFAKPKHGRSSTVRTIYDLKIAYREPRIVIGVEGNGFLWQMVRIIVGTLMGVALGVHRPEEVPEMLEARDRRAAGLTAPPQGLYLQWIRTGYADAGEQNPDISSELE